MFPLLICDPDSMLIEHVHECPQGPEQLRVCKHTNVAQRYLQLHVHSNMSLLKFIRNHDMQILNINSLLNMQQHIVICSRHSA